MGTELLYLVLSHSAYALEGKLIFYAVGHYSCYMLVQCTGIFFTLHAYFSKSDQ